MKAKGQSKETVFYQSFVRGEASRTEPKTVYYGFTERVKYSLTYDRAHFDAVMRAQMAKIDKFIDSLPSNMEAGQPIERYEVLDTAEEDEDGHGYLLIMWRIPVHERKS